MFGLLPNETRIPCQGLVEHGKWQRTEKAQNCTLCTPRPLRVRNQRSAKPQEESSKPVSSFWEKDCAGMSCAQSVPEQGVHNTCEVAHPHADAPTAEDYARSEY